MANNVCLRCERPVVYDPKRHGWVHAEAADAAFCQLVMQAGKRAGDD